MKLTSRPFIESSQFSEQSKLHNQPATGPGDVVVDTCAVSEGPGLTSADRTVENDVHEAAIIESAAASVRAIN
jgi:hypothetical protein